jgi:hypothetical protein
MSVVAVDDSMALTKWRTPALVIGIIGVLLSALGASLDVNQFLRSYLYAFVFMASLSLGSLVILMIQYLTGGGWGLVIRRVAEAAARVMPLVLIAFIPIVFGLRHLYSWTDPQLMASDHVMHAKAGYLNMPFFVGRSAFYLIAWIIIAFFMTRWSAMQEETVEYSRTLALRKISAFGLVFMALTLSFASVDWLMSLQPKWYSTMFGISYMVGNVLSGFAFVIIIATCLATSEPLSRFIEPIYFRDLGNLLFAAIMFWAYVTFSEFLLIWYANLREEVPWHLTRMRGGWGVITLMLVVLHFFLPWFILLMRSAKDHGQRLRLVAILILLMRVVYYYWIVMPTYHEQLRISWMDIATVAGLTGIWMFFFVSQLRKLPLLPMYETQVREALVHG